MALDQYGSAALIEIQLAAVRSALDAVPMPTAIKADYLWAAFKERFRTTTCAPDSGCNES